MFVLGSCVRLPLPFKTGVIRTMFNFTHWKLVISEGLFVQQKA